MQLFDDRDSRVTAVSAYIREGLVSGDTLLAIVPAERWDAIAVRLRAQHVALKRAVETGQLTLRDPRDILKAFVKKGRLDGASFEVAISGMVRALAERGRPLRVYGEVVDLLSAQGDFRGALEVERCWNELGARESFSLLCGYSASSFGDPGHADALRRICHAHSQIRSNPRDVLGSFLLDTHGADSLALRPLSHPTRRDS
jgi:hypothetical protein